MSLSRRDFGKLALAGIPAAYLIEETPLLGSALFQATPNSLFNGIQIGVITYSYRSMQDQSGEATLKYILDSGINAVELMDGPAEMFAGRPQPSARRGGGPGGGAPGAPGAGGGGRGGGRAASRGGSRSGSAPGGRWTGRAALRARSASRRWWRRWCGGREARWRWWSSAADAGAACRTAGGRRRPQKMAHVRLDGSIQGA